MLIIYVRNTSDAYTSAAFKKKFAFHTLLVLTTACDLPLYIGFVATGNYVVIPYAFHKWESALLFAAYSITIYNWSAVLYDLKEDTSFPFFMRKATLVGVNILFLTISFVNFVYCIYLNNLVIFSESWIYTAFM